VLTTDGFIEVGFDAASGSVPTPLPSWADKQLLCSVPIYNINTKLFLVVWYRYGHNLSCIHFLAFVIASGGAYALSSTGRTIQM
jgi:hypothetical protein